MEYKIGEVNGNPVYLEKVPYGDPICIIRLQDQVYASITGEEIDRMDNDHILSWVKETAENEDHLSDQYTPPRVDASIFVNNQKKSCEDFLDQLVNESFFDVVIDEMHLMQDFKPEVLLKLMKDEASKRNITLSDVSDWDYDREFTNLYKNTEKGLS